jgi:hypothetical protein
MRDRSDKIGASPSNSGIAFVFPPLAQIPKAPDEYRIPIQVCFGHRQFHVEQLAILPHGLHLATDADDVSDSSLCIGCQILVVVRSNVSGRHEHGYVSPEQLGCLVTKRLGYCLVGGQDRAKTVYREHGINRVLKDDLPSCGVLSLTARQGRYLVPKYRLLLQMPSQRNGEKNCNDNREIQWAEESGEGCDRRSNHGHSSNCFQHEISGRESKNETGNELCRVLSGLQRFSVGERYMTFWSNRTVSRS